MVHCASARKRRPIAVHSSGHKIPECNPGDTGKVAGVLDCIAAQRFCLGLTREGVNYPRDLIPGLRGFRIESKPVEGSNFDVSDIAPFPCPLQPNIHLSMTSHLEFFDCHYLALGSVRVEAELP